MEDKTAYPAARYHADNPPVLVNSKAEDVALGPGWYDHPAKPHPKKPEPELEIEPETVPAKAPAKDVRGF